MRVVPRRWARSPTRSTKTTLEKLPGHLAIGHTRYSTAGESKLENAQPFLIDCAHGQIAVAHNGNLVNARELRDELVRDGSIFQTSSDTEVVLHLYARSKAPTVEDALVESIAQVQRRLLAGAADQEPADRRARSARVPSAGARPARRRVDRLLGDLRARSDRRDLRARRRARRGAASSATAASARSSRFRRSRSRTASSSTSTSRGPTATCSAAASTRCAPSSAGSSRASRRSTPTSSCRFPTPASAPRSAMPRRRACRCGWA